MAKHCILGMGNPLLDYSACVKPELLEKYGLKSNDAILYDKEDIFEELKADYDVEYIAGKKVTSVRLVTSTNVHRTYIGPGGQCYDSK
jgi:adenosine kinase